MKKLEIDIKKVAEKMNISYIKEKNQQNTLNYAK